MPSPRSGESRQNFVGRCMSSAEAQASFPHTDQRLAFCESTYDRHAHSGNQYAHLQVTTATCAARKQQFLGRQFRVVPAVLVRAQVLHNNLGTTYLPAEEITEDWAALWNGIPVLVGPHPSMRGVASSGRTPEIWNERGVGWIFGAKADNDKDGVRRLTGEVWLDESRAGSVKGFDVILDSLDRGKHVELSTGFPTQSDAAMGVHNGETYELVLHPAGADHLIISTEMTGACAVADGCGLGANEERKKSMEAENIKPNATEQHDDFLARCNVDPVMVMRYPDKAARGAACSMAWRDAMQGSQVTEPGLNVEVPPEVWAANDGNTQSVGGTPHPASDFAYAPAGSNASDWKLPIFDAEHVRAALARFNQTQLPAAARGHVWRRILAAADRFNITVSDRTMPGASSSRGFKALLSKVAELLGSKSERKELSFEDRQALQLGRIVAIADQQGMSDRDKAEALEEALEELWEEKYPEFAENPGAQCDAVVSDVYSDEKQVVWWMQTPMGPMPAGDQFYQSSYSDKGNGEYTVSEPALVQRVTRYEPVATTAPAAQQSHNQEATMADEKEKNQIAELAGVVANLAETVKAIAGKVDSLASAGAPAELAGLKKTMGELASKFDKMEGVTNAAIAERERERQSLVQELAGNFRVPFTAAELESKPIEELRKLREMVKAENYGGKGGPVIPGAETRYAEPEPYFRKDKKEGGN